MTETGRGRFRERGQGGDTAAGDRAADIVVVGGGFGGVTAALRAAELGLRAVLIEKGTGEAYPCNSRMSGGIVHVGFRDIRRPPDELVQAVEASTAGETDPVLIRALADNIGRWVDWLQGNGARFMRFNLEEGYRWCMAPPRALVPGPDWEGRGPDVLLRDLVARFRATGGEVRLGTRALDLVVEGSGCAGVIAECGGARFTLRAPAVVIADGGFQADRDAFTTLIGPDFDAVFQRGAATGTGDGMRMAERAGARLTDRQPFYGHLLAGGVHENGKLWPYPELDAFATAGIIVGPDGRRIGDGGQGGVAVANDLARMAVPDCATAIFDAAIWEGPGRAHRIPANPLLEQAGAEIYRADTLAALAAMVGLPCATLEATVAAHNTALDAGRLDTLDPPRGTRVPGHRIDSPPYMAIRVVPGITYTMGGIAVDGAARVLSTEGRPIPGLYAAGAATGGIEGGSRKAYVGGISKAGVFGLLAAEDAAGRVRKVEVPTEIAAPVSRYPMLDLVVRHGHTASWAGAGIAGIAVAALLWGVSAPLAVAGGAGTGVLVWLAMRVLTELVTLVTEMLMPR